MKILIFGGAFNPVHNEHLNIVRSAIKKVGADKVIIVPTGTSPHKSGKLTVADEIRIKACEIAFSSLNNVEVSTYEIENGGVSYSYLTCRHFKNLYPDDELFFLVGADMLKGFPTWKNPQEILSLATLVACRRQGINGFDDDAKMVEETFNTKVLTAEYSGLNVSSTKIRTLLSLGESVSEYLNKDVHDYLKSANAYRIDNLIKAKDLLTEKRWWHSVRVAVMCAQNCSRANLDEMQAITMGALHDVAKYLKPDDERLKNYSVPSGVPNPVLHQYTGAYVARNTFGITDEIVLSAIECHTSAKPYMTDADVLLYLADMLEEDRNFTGIEQLRILFYKDLTKCITRALEMQVDYLIYRGAPVYHKTLDAYKFFKDKQKNGQ